MKAKINSRTTSMETLPAIGAAAGIPGGKANKRQAVYQFKAGETYTLVVSGRSKDFRIDRIAFRKTGTSGSLDGAESSTFTGTPPVADSCDTTIAAGTFNAESHPANDAVIKDNGSTVGAITNGSWIRFDNFNFGQFEGGSIDLQASTPNAGGTIELRTDSETGPLLGTVKVRKTNGWTGWTIFSGPAAAVSGVKNLYFVFKGGSGSLFDLNNFSFHSGETRQEKPDAPPVNPPAGRIAIVADGNSPDPDDISATATMLALLRATTLDDRLVHLSHCCDLVRASNISATQEQARYVKMQTACDGTRTRWGGFEGMTFWNCKTQQTDAINDLKNAINASSASDPLWIIEAGEPDIIGYALRQATSSKRQYVKLITHHPVNDQSGDYIDFSEIENSVGEVVRVPDQNGASFADINEGLQRPLWAFYWARDHADTRIKWLWDQVVVTESDTVVGFQDGKCDVSDAGMMVYWITGANVNDGYFTADMYDLQDLIVTGGVTGPDSGLVAHWPLDEGAGTTTANAAGTPYTATLLNGSGWGGDATRPSYVTFDGDNDRISTTFTYALRDTDDFTWAWWANKLSAEGQDGGAIMVGNRYPERGSPKYGFIKMTPNEAQFANTDSTANIGKYNYADVLQGGWHHYAMVKKGSSFQWYVDGVAAGAPQVFSYSETSPVPFLIGGDDDGSGTKTGEHFQGCIDDVVLYRDALAAADIANVMNGIYIPSDPPTISSIPDQTILPNTSAGPLPFTIGDDVTAADALTLTKQSSNPALLPVENIVLGGSGANRTMTVTPLPDQSGSAAVTLGVNDGSLNAMTNFTLTVLPLGTTIQSVVFNTAGTTTWNCPEGVNSIKVECWGGGGAGGGATRTTSSGGAGGGGAAAGAYASSSNIPVTPEESYGITIPEATVCPAVFTNGQRFDGASVTFVGDSGTTVTAAGGQGGACHVGNAVGAVGLGSVAGSLGDQLFKGGDGGNNGSNNGGNGGGGPSDLAAGGIGSTTSYSDGGDGAIGSDPAHRGGDGGAGRGGNNAGYPGLPPAGGGGGAKSQTTNGTEVGGTGGLGQIILTYFQVPVEPPNTALEDWRELHFGTTENSGIAADDHDANGDGEVNLLEFATGQNPHQPLRLATPLEIESGLVSFFYTRSKAAVADGLSFQVEWNETLELGDWHSTDVVDVADPDQADTATLEFRKATVPMGSGGRRFLHLRVN